MTSTRTMMVNWPMRLSSMKIELLVRRSSQVVTFRKFSGGGLG